MAAVDITLVGWIDFLGLVDQKYKILPTIDIRYMELYTSC